jgi:cyanophycin synthetase
VSEIESIAALFPSAKLETGPPALTLARAQFWPGATSGFDMSVLAVPVAFNVPAEQLSPAAVERVQTLLSQQWPSYPGPLFVNSPAPASMAEVVLRLALCLQHEAAHPVSAGQVQRQGAHLLLVMPCHHAPTGHAAVKLAASFTVQAMTQVFEPPQALSVNMAVEVANFMVLARKAGLLPNTHAFITAARQRGIPWLNLGHGVVQFGQGVNARRLDGSFTDRTASIGVRLARHKAQAADLLRQAGLPVPAQLQTRTADEAVKAALTLTYPVAVKPLSQDQGSGVAAGLLDEAAVRKAFAAAAKFGTPVLVEKHIPGDDHRMLVVNGRLLSAIRRVPGGVTGDGVHTVVALVDLANRDPRRGEGKAALVLLTLNEEAQDLLAEQGLTADDVPAVDRMVRLRRIGNLSTGGLPESVTDIVHPDNRMVAVRAARVLGLDIAGIDFLCTDISRSWREVGGGICEVNAQPGFRPHWFGEPERDVNGRILEMLLQGQGRIPLAAITGTNDKTMVCQMLHRILLAAGLNAGLSTSQGVWIGQDQISHDSLAGWPGGRILLSDSSVQAAVIEMPLKGLLTQGFPFDVCDVATVINVQVDDVGRDGVQTLEQLAQIKASVLQRAHKAIVVNVDDPLCVSVSQRSRARRQIHVSAQTPLPPVLQAHVAQGGTAVVLDPEGPLGGRLQVLTTAGRETVIDMQPENVLSALLAIGLALGLGQPLGVIRTGLASAVQVAEGAPC